MRPGDKFDIFEYRMNPLSGIVRLRRRYSCVLKVVSNTKEGEYWVATGTQEDGDRSRKFTSNDIGRRFDDEVLYLLENSISKASDVYIWYYDHAANYHRKKAEDYYSYVERIKAVQKRNEGDVK